MMIKRAQVFLKQLVILIDAAAIVAAFLCTYFLRQQAYVTHSIDDFVPGEMALGALRSLDNYLWLLWIILPLWLGTLHIMGAYRDLRVKSFRTISWAALKSSLLSLLIFSSIIFLLKLHYVSRIFLFLFFVLAFCYVSLERAALIWFFRLIMRRRYFRRKLLIVGTGRRARILIKNIEDHASAWGLRIVGLLDPEPQTVGEKISGVRVLGTLEHLPALLQNRVIDEVIFVVPRSWMTKIEQPILYCERVGVRATVAIDLFNLNLAKAHLSDLDGMPFISFETTPVNEWQLAIKRLGDFLFALIGTVVLAPLFLFTALLIKATSPGPIFFRQTRCGVNGRKFVLYKFRSMVADAEGKQAELGYLNEMSGPVFKATNDPRLTPVGHWLRRTSIDELPQLINVLRSEMSLIGPRPPMPNEVEKYEYWQRRRLSMRPGITGLWQVKGRSSITSFDEWMRLDLEYIDRWSLWLDMNILFSTIPAVLFARGAK